MKPYTKLAKLLITLLTESGKSAQLDNTYAAGLNPRFLNHLSESDKA